MTLDPSFDEELAREQEILRCAAQLAQLAVMTEAEAEYAIRQIMEVRSVSPTDAFKAIRRAAGGKTSPGTLKPGYLLALRMAAMGLASGDSPNAARQLTPRFGHRKLRKKRKQQRQNASAGRR